MKSMTGYGRCRIEEDGREMTVEVKSVNHRFLDTSYRLSRTLSFLDNAVRTGVSSRLARGHVDVFVNYENHRQDAKEICVDTALTLAYRDAFSRLAQVLDKKEEVSLIDYARLPEVLAVQEREEDQEALRKLFLRALSGALDELVVMREQEGERMRLDILEKMENIDRMRGQVSVRAPFVVNEYRDKLHARVKALVDGEIDENRLMNEVAVFADRAAIDEELVRLQSHIQAIRESVNSDEPIGRKLDFLVQELNREVNTIGSKASDVGIAQNVVAMKGEIEKLREQVQNIE